MTAGTEKRAVVGWILYDWANSAFALTVMTAFFPVFFKKFWCAGFESAFSTVRLNLGNAAAGLLIAALAPFLGALADAGRSRKRFLVAFMLLGVTMTAWLSQIDQGMWAAALGVFIVANVGFSCANLFYDSLLPCVATGQRMDVVSSTGYAVGYLGCAILFIVNMLMVGNPEAFGLKDKAHAMGVSLLSVSAWWFVFSIPLMLWVREARPPTGENVVETVRASLRQLRATFRDIRRRKPLWLFLLAYWLYIDGVHTFIRAAADLGLSIGIDEKGLMVSLLVVQLVAFPAAYVFGLAAQRWGARHCLMVGIAIYGFVALVGPSAVRTTMQYGFFAALSAVPLGALQALSRSYYARMIPEDRAAEYFGFYSLMGKFAVVLGPAVVGLVALVVRAAGASSATAARCGAGSLTLFFVVGAVLLHFAGKARER